MHNHLAQEKSPYLLQHKDNPIHWYAWGEEAFRQAREQNKPVFLSIGYSTCHWCHVMAHESFEDAEVADQLNLSYISIKVDREERPDVDSLYMKALQAMTGGGGWPMSVWLTPDGKPFFAGTYYPKYRFQQLLRRISEVWSNQREDLTRDCDHMMKSIAALDARDPETQATKATDEQRAQFLAAYTTHFQHVLDEEFGGFGSAPKFPQTMNLMLMMRQDFKTGLKQAEVVVTTTLLKMLRGGMYDHLRGGFHRYSVDRQWLVPHFEKMLYDQALITVTLLEAHKMYGEPEFARAARETLDYVLREMTDPQGGFYSAQDADSLNPATGHKDEGYFATYAYDELKSTLSEGELKALTEVYGITQQGQYEGRNILHLQNNYDGTAKAQRADLRTALERLEKVRAAKPPPHLDDKIIASWNGWMIWAFATAGRLLNEPRYTDAAKKAFKFVRTHLWSDGKLKRFYREGGAYGSAMAEDFAAIVHAGLELQLADAGTTTWLIELQAILDKNFWDSQHDGYFTGDGADPLLPVRTKDEYDGVSPGANSMAAYNLSRLYALTGERGYHDRAERLFTWLFPRLNQFPSGLAFFGLAMDFARSKPRAAVCVGGGWTTAFIHERGQIFHPYVIWTTAESSWPLTEHKRINGIYMCSEGQCLKPAATREEALQQLV